MTFKNQFQEELYKNLMTLCDTIKEFKYKKIDVPGGHVKIFGYILAGYENFVNNDSALDCRGATFFVPDDENSQITLIALPIRKFFSIGEGYTHEIKERKIEDAEYAMIKEDGSLITSCISPITNDLHFKSRDNYYYVNMTALNKAISDELSAEIKRFCIEKEASIDMEFTSPENRVIKEYKEYTVSFINARSLNTGEDIDLRSDDFANAYPLIASHLVKKVKVSDIDLKRNDIEGYVVVMKNGERFKVKTIPYLSMVSAINFQAKDALPQNLYSSAVYQMMDEVRTLLHYKNRSPNFPIDLLIKQADLVEKYAQETYIPMRDSILNFVEENKDLSDQEFIAKTKKELPQYMNAIMPLRKGVNFDIEAFAIRMFGKGAKKPFKEAEDIINSQS